MRLPVSCALSSDRTTARIYIYIYPFSRHFYPNRLTVHSGYTLFCFFNQYVCSLGIEHTTFGAANAMLYHGATGTRFHEVNILEHNAELSTVKTVQVQQLSRPSIQEFGWFKICSDAGQHCIVPCSVLIFIKSFNC